MVLLTMTPGIVRALSRVESALPEEFSQLHAPSSPSLAQPAPGSPISHTQLIALSKLVQALPQDASSAARKRHSADEATAAGSGTPDTHPESNTHATTNTTDLNLPTTLAALLTGTTPYHPPPSPKPTQTPEYHALMARLRFEAEQQSYTAMLAPPPTRETFSSRFPSARSRVPEPFSLGTDEVDELSYAETHRQIILIINVLISILCVAVFVWFAAWHWSVGLRLGLALGSGFGVGVAEVGVYSGYVRKVAEAKRVEGRKVEVKEVVASWVLDGEGPKGKGVATGKEKDDGVRYRKGRHR